MGGKVGFMGLVNYKDHPTDNRYVIFNFNTIDEASHFETLLNKDNIHFDICAQEIFEKINVLPLLQFVVGVKLDVVKL